MSVVEHERIDTLLALAIAFARAEVSPPLAPKPDDDGYNAAHASPVADFLHTLSPLPAHDRAAVERRRTWYENLSADKQAKWLGRTLRRARPDAQTPQLGEHIHPTHVIEALRDEPRRIQLILLGQLPARLADACADALELTNFRQPAQAQPVAPNGDGRERRLPSKDEQPDTELVGLVRRRFLCRFVNINQLPNPTHLDSLSGAELARLIRLSGVREAAIACRGVAQVENIASLWRRFPAEDARAFAAHMATLADVEPARVSFAEELVGEALRADANPTAMLDHAGMLLVALVMHAGDSRRLLHTAQKLPLNAALWFREISDHLQQQHRHQRDIIRHIAAETEALATNLRRASRRSDKHSSMPDEPVR